MQSNFVFQIRSLSIQEGFEMECDGVLERPLRIGRLFEAVATAAQLGSALGGEIHIFDVRGEVVEVLPIPTATHEHRRIAA